MTYLLDTDHLSILQRKAGLEYQRISAWMAQFTALDFACCVVKPTPRTRLTLRGPLFLSVKSSNDLAS